MKHSLKELIDSLHISDDECQRFKLDTDQFIEEARKGQNWAQWKKEVFEQYFEKMLNCIAKLGNGQMSTAEKAIVKEHWMELAPHLKAIAESQDIPLWDEYKAIREIIKKQTNKNLNVATNRMLAGLQPKLLCTECDITRINKLVDYLRNYTDAQITDYDPVCWERASYSLSKLIKSVEKDKPYWALSPISWMLLDECESRYVKPPKRWLVFANRNMWHHAEALHEIGFINWTMHRVNFSIGDLVYLFMSDERRIRFLTKVTAEKCERGDLDYMVDEDDLYPDTYKLELVAEAMNEELKEDNLRKHGFKGGSSLQSPIYNNPELFEYIMPFFQKNSDDRTYWLIPSNTSIFRLDDCLAKSDYVDWRHSFSPQIGDVVFIYLTKPEQKIRYMMEVTKINIPYKETLDDSEFWGEGHKPHSGGKPDVLYNRLKLLSETDSPALHLNKLQKVGMKGVPQGPRKLSGELLSYVLSYFTQPTAIDYDEIKNPETVPEGAKKEIVVNRYERSLGARKKCIAAHGCKCAVCGMDFEKVYGDIGRGFIHVHHIVPISTIGKEYELDPVKDLVPVCPNCHAMLHKKEPPYMVEELKRIIGWD